MVKNGIGMVVMTVMTAVILSCGGARQASSEKAVPMAKAHPALSSRDSLRYQYFFHEAVRQQEQGNLADAFDLLTHALSINPLAAEGHFLMSMYLSGLNSDSAALHAMEQAASLAPQNSYYQERLAQYFIGTRRYDEALAVYESLSDSHRDRTDILEILMQFYQHNKDYNKLLGVIGRIEQQMGISEELTLSKMHVYELQGNKEAAREALQSLADEYPNDLSYRVMMGNWLMQNDQREEAGRIFTEALQEEPDNGYVQASIYDYYRSVGQDSLAKDMMERILISKKATTDNKVTIIRQLISESEQAGGDSTRVLDMFNRVLSANPEDVDMAELKVAYMSLKKMPEDSIMTSLRNILNIAPDNMRARLQLLQYHLDKTDWESLIDLCTTGTQYHPEEMVFYYYLGLAYYQTGDEDMALNAFQRGVSQINKESNAHIVSDFYYFMGDILHKKGKQQEAFAAYDSCLQWKDDNIACLNNYAYYLCETTDDLKRAEQMSYKTIKEEPQNATYLDTYAWILFLQKRYAEALPYIDQAVACDTDTLQSAVVLEHAGDIHAMNDDLPAALELWQRALDNGSDSPMILRKIKARKYIKDKKKQ